MLSLINTCVKQEMFLHGVALLKGQIDTTLVLASSLVPVWTLLSMRKDNFLTILMDILTHWMWGFLGKLAFFLANPWRLQRIEPAALRKYELSLIHMFCGETDWLEPIICLLFVCVGGGTGPHLQQHHHQWSKQGEICRERWQPWLEQLIRSKDQEFLGPETEEATFQLTKMGKTCFAAWVELWLSAWCLVRQGYMVPTKMKEMLTEVAS